MIKYIIKRILLVIVVVLGVAVIIFSILYFVPGDPAELLLPDNATQVEIDAMKARLGLDQPYLVQLGTFLYNTFIKFDLGESWQSGVPVMGELLSRLPRTVLMGLATIAIGIIFGIPLGVLAAIHQNKWQDYGVLGVCMVFVSLPQFWVALELVVLFSLRLKLLPAYGVGGIEYYILPLVCVALNNIANTGRQTRSAVLEVIRADYITTSRAKGQSEWDIIKKHMLPNALMPIITITGNHVAHVVAGTTIMEKIFGIPGVGLYLLDGIFFRDYPVIRGCTIFFGIFCAVTMLIVDLCYAWLDPRIRARYKASSVKKDRRIKA